MHLYIYIYMLVFSKSSLSHIFRWSVATATVPKYYLVCQADGAVDWNRQIEHRLSQAAVLAMAS